MQRIKHLTSVKNILILAFTLLQFLGFSQFEHLRNYTVKDGLPGSETYAVTQDSKGYIWVVGDMGVNRFNGYEFRNFNTNDGLPDNTIFGVWEDSKNRIWFRSFSGKLSYYRNDSIYTLPCNDTIEKLMHHGINLSMHVDEKDTIWLGINMNFVLKINPGWKNTDLKKIMLDPGKYIYCIDNNIRVFGGSSPEKIMITAYNRSSQRLFTIDPQVSHIGSSDIRFYLTSTDDGKFLAGLDKLVLKFDAKKIHNMTRMSHLVIHLLKDTDGTILVSTYNGVFILEKEHLEQRGTIPTLSGKVVTWAYPDKEGELWFSTEGNGLFCQEHRKFKYYTSNNGLPVSKISCMTLADKKVLTGHLDGSVCILKNDTIQTLTVNTIQNSSVLQTRINSFLQFNNEALITTVAQTYRLKGNKTFEIPVVNAVGIKKLIKSKDGNLWAMTYGRMIKLNPDNFTWLKDLTLNTRIDASFEDMNGTLWFVYRNKIHLYENGTTKEFSEYNKRFNLRVIDITETSDKRIWIITKGGGLIVWNGKEFKQITEQSGLAGNMCKSLLVDSAIVWVGTNKGLSKITIEKNGGLTIDNIYDSNGLFTNEINSIVRSGDKLWIAHNTAISIFDPKNLKTNSYSVPVYVLSAVINDSVSMPKKSAILTYNQNNITVNYVGLSFKNAGHVEYKYKMSGLDSNWTYSTNTSVKFHTMPPGKYTFYVYAKNNDGYWSKSAATLSFKIEPARWQTTQFKLVITLFWLLIIALTFKLRLRIIQKRTKEKAELQNRISQIELKALRSQMNPHFVYNAINSVQYFILNNDPESSQKYLAKFARLIRYVVDNSKPSSIPLQTEINAIILYLELEALRFETMFEYKVEVDPVIDTTYVQIPSMLVQPYVENAIWHGLMHKKEKGSIEIRFTMESDVLKCVIEDDGIGRKRSQEIKNDTSVVSRKSLGMSITKERLEIISQLTNTELRVMITDKENEHGEPTGTKVELLIPFN